MSQRFFSPSEQFCDQSGLPLSGGTITWYSSGTSSKLNTYSDQALTVANSNPVLLDSSGRAGNVFLQTLPYKMVLADVNGNQIYTADPVYSSDYSTTAQFQVFAGNPTGSVAGTAGSGSIPATAVYDTVDNVLYVATTTGTAATTVWFPINATAQSSVAYPGGYLSPQQLTADSATYALTTNSTAATQIFYNQAISNIVPIFNGSSFTSFTFGNALTFTLTTTAHIADSVYDIFVFNNSGVATLCSGPAWTSLTGRGSGAATTQLSNLNGIWVNASPLLTPVNGATTYTAIAPNFATYLGSVYTDHVAGTVTCTVTSGQNRKWGIYNAYNRRSIPIVMADPTGTPWAYSTATWRASNNVPSSITVAATNAASGITSNSITVVQGLAEEYLDIEFSQYVIAANGGGPTLTNNGIAINASGTPSPSGKLGIASTQTGGSSVTAGSNVLASYQVVPSLGVTAITAIEKGNGTATSTFNGTDANMQLLARLIG